MIDAGPGQENVSGSSRQAQTVFPQTPQSEVGPNGGSSRATVFSDEADVYIVGDSFHSSYFPDDVIRRAK